MRISETDIAKVRRKFADVEGNLPVRELNSLYNRTFNSHLPPFNPRQHGARTLEALRDYSAQHGMPPWGVERFGYTEDWKPELNSELPEWDKRKFVLVAAYMDRLPPLPTELDWNFLEHVCDHVMRDHVHMIAAELRPCPDVCEALSAICEYWWNKYCDTTVYQRQLAALGLCWEEPDQGRHETIRGNLTPREAFYPIKLTEDAWRRVVSAPPFPKFLAEGGTAPKPILLMLSANSD
jgi:hypothetical protein